MKEGQSAQAKEIVFEAGDTQVPQNLREDTGNTDEPPVVKANPKDWFKKPERPPTPDPKWNEGKTVDNKPTRKWLSDLAKAETSSKTFNDLMSTSIVFNAFVMNRLQISDLTQDILVGPAYNLLKGTYRSFIELEYNMEECYKAPTDQLDWNNPEGESTGRTYTTSLTKIKAAKYDLPRIEDMVPNLWIGISPWGPQRQRFYEYVINKVSKHDVYSTMRIQSVISGIVNKWYGYGHLKEIVIRRAYQKLYKFMEGDFLRLHLNNIEDMLLLVVQNRLNNLKGDVTVGLAKALRMYTRRIIIQKRVEDLQLCVESYHKKLNISKPRTCDIDMSRRTLYTTLSEPQGVVYKDKLKKKRLMRTKELYKFSDGTLTSVRNTLDHMLQIGLFPHMCKTLSNIDAYMKGGQNQRDLPRDIPSDRIEVLRYDTKGVKVRKGIMQSKTELTLEQTQQGVSDEVLVSIEGLKNEKEM
ncbi:hypothetical protein Tco_0902621 [Tanacetum coccineum]